MDKIGVLLQRWENFSLENWGFGPQTASYAFGPSRPRGTWFTCNGPRCPDISTSASNNQNILVHRCDHGSGLFKGDVAHSTATCSPNPPRSTPLSSSPPLRRTSPPATLARVMACLIASHLRVPVSADVESSPECPVRVTRNMANVVVRHDDKWREPRRWNWARVLTRRAAAMGR